MDKCGLIFSWDNFPDFVTGLFGADADDISRVESGAGYLDSVDLETEIFDGLFEFFRFQNDVAMLVIDGKFHKPVHLNVLDGDWIRFNFALSITLDMGVIGAQPMILNSPSWRIVDHPTEAMVTEIPPAGAEAKWVTIICKRNVIEEITNLRPDDLPDFLRTVGADQYRSSLYRDFVIRSRLMSITSDIINTRVESPIYLPYMNARATELLCLSLDELLDPIDIDGLPALTSAEHERIEVARAFVDRNYKASPTILEIAKQAGLNRNSLYYGFKRLVGVNVSDYIQNLKLEEARHLLLHTDTSITDITEQVGFKHQSGLTTAFRRKYSVTPGQLRRK